MRLIWVAALLVSTPVLRAQLDTATVLGSIRDNSGAVVSSVTSSRIAAPNSARIFLGSLTARDRYGFILYQSVGNPSTGLG
jgi:hypothetical protein